jgi:hypothetical protein
MPPSIKISNDGGDLPVTVAIDHIASVAVLQQLWIKPLVIGPRIGMRSYTGLARSLGHLLVA